VNLTSKAISLIQALFADEGPELGQRFQSDRPYRVVVLRTRDFSSVYRRSQNWYTPKFIVTSARDQTSRFANHVREQSGPSKPDESRYHLITSHASRQPVLASIEHSVIAPKTARGVSDQGVSDRKPSRILRNLIALAVQSFRVYNSFRETMPKFNLCGADDLEDDLA
jgi:hypothetical protein